MGEFDVMMDLGQLLPALTGEGPLEWETLKASWRSNNNTTILLNSVSLTLKAIRIELGSLSPSFNVVAEQFTHPVELTLTPSPDDVEGGLLQKSCPLDPALPFIKAQEMAAMSDVDGAGKFEMITSNLGPWARKVVEEPEFNDAGIPFSPFVVGYAKKMEMELKDITVTVDEEDVEGVKNMKRTLGVRWNMKVHIRPIFGEQKDFVPIQLHDIHSDLERWMNRVDESKRLCACEVSTYAWSSVAGAAVPIPGTSVFADIAITAKMSSRFKTIFQETVKMDEIVADLKTRFDCVPEEILVSNIRFLTTYIIQREAELIAEGYLHQLVLSHVGNHTLKTAAHWVPFLGTVVSTSLAYPFMRHTGFHLIGEYEKTYVEGFKEMHDKLASFST